MLFLLHLLLKDNVCAVTLLSRILQLLQDFYHLSAEIIDLRKRENTDYSETMMHDAIMHLILTGNNILGSKFVSF